MAHDNTYSVLVTGANSGLGFAICTRLIDEFFTVRDQYESLQIILTTRSKQKSDDTKIKLREHVLALSRTYTKDAEQQKRIRSRITIRSEILDLCSIRAIQELGKRLRYGNTGTGEGQLRKLDAVILNAGIGGWTGVKWGRAIWTVLTDWAHAVTFPTFKISSTGDVCKPQLSDTKASDEPPLGEVFTANVFGHYLLVHYLMPQLSTHRQDKEQTGRVIWLSSLEAYGRALSLDDFQGLRAPEAYESSKRVTDVLALTSELSSTEKIVDNYSSPCSQPPWAFYNAVPGANGSAEPKRPKMYVAHPGICATGIFPLPTILAYAMIAAFYVARWIGSIWHTCTPYKGACAPTWLALAPQSSLDAMEEREGKGKWGSSTDFWGRERVTRTEVEGWGWGGRVGESTRLRKGRWRYAKDLTEESRKEFEETGWQVWREIEGLRVQWEDRIGKAGA